MFQIQVSDSDATNGSVAVSWCIDSDTLENLRHSKTRDPVVVLCVAPADPEVYDSNKEVRKIVPLKDLMSYLEFRTPGKVKIWGFISYKSLKGAKNEYLYRGYYGYQCSILNSDGSDFAKHIKEDSLMNSEPLSVLVPEGCFAPEPSEIEKTWVNWLFRDKAVDQCEFRRRRMFAYTLQPFLFLANMALRVLALFFALFFGLRATNLTYLRHPFITGLDSCAEQMTDGSIFIGRGPNEYLNHARLIISPFVILLLGGLIKYGFIIPLLLITVVVAVLSTLALTALFFLKKKFGEPEEEDKDEAWYEDEEEQATLMCDGSGKARTLSSLPGKHKTLKLRFYDLKSKVCRPFSA